MYIIDDKVIGNLLPQSSVYFPPFFKVVDSAMKKLVDKSEVIVIMYSSESEIKVVHLPLPNHDTCMKMMCSKTRSLDLDEDFEDIIEIIIN